SGTKMSGLSVLAKFSVSLCSLPLYVFKITSVQLFHCYEQTHCRILAIFLVMLTLNFTGCL
uniref:Uncharacterized protein n=1 Tax=Accipiter nisus TaxID=211598 RepID=A0A8B9M412_9AVES